MAQPRYMPGSADITVGDDALGDLVTALYDIANHARHAADGDPVEPAATRVLAWVQALGAPRPSELATRLRLDLSTVSRHVRALTGSGHLVVSPDEQDGRAQRVTLTDAGQEALRTVVQNRRAAVGDVVADWSTEDRDRLAALLRRLADGMARTRTEVDA